MKVNREFYEFMEKVNNCYWLHRFLFFFNCLTIFKVAYTILKLKQHVQTFEMVTFGLSMLYIVVCWKNFQWGRILRKEKDDGQESKR